MNKQEFLRILKDDLSSYKHAWQSWGIAGSYAFKDGTTELVKTKDIDVIIWITHEQYRNDIIKCLALLSLRIVIVIHPILLAKSESNIIAHNEHYQKLLISFEEMEVSNRDVS